MKKTNNSFHLGFKWCHYSMVVWRRSFMFFFRLLNMNKAKLLFDPIVFFSFFFAFLYFIAFLFCCSLPYSLALLLFFSFLCCSLVAPFVSLLPCFIVNHINDMLWNTCQSFNDFYITGLWGWSLKTISSKFLWELAQLKTYFS
jgi:hypothetical protein